MTIPGKVFGCICAIFGVLIVSLPVGVISSKFSRLLEKERKEKHIIKMEIELTKLQKRIYLFDEKFNAEVASASRRRELSDMITEF